MSQDLIIETNDERIVIGEKVDAQAQHDFMGRVHELNAQFRDALWNWFVSGEPRAVWKHNGKVIATFHNQAGMVVIS